MFFPIRQHVGRLAGLTRVQRDLLIAAISLAEHGDRGYCYASNDFLAAQVAASPRTVSRRLAELAALNLLEIDGRTHSRRIVASPALRPCYASDTKAACLAATVVLGQQLSSAKMARNTPPAVRDNAGAIRAIPDPEFAPIRVEIQDKPGRVHKEIHKEQKLEEKKETAALRMELAKAKKKIAALEQLLAQAPGPAPTAPSPATHTGGAPRPGPEPAAARPSGRGATARPDGVVPFSSALFLEGWDRYRRYRTEQRLPPFLGGQQEQAALQALALLANNDESIALQLIAQTIRKGWKDFYPLDSTRHDPYLLRPHRPVAADVRLRHALGNPSFAGDAA
ncbi:helix-turn-helix domain-containing protein [Hymenobacter terricola]|uniref:helix-turn-helix domain-containing protein n=1 Tax=Hymenobacter terricola TaxID=2819236 RepID=UPI001B31147E|nr:helix-turn-helix domain-containing protein [Hymenobacter terricola]